MNIYIAVMGCPPLKHPDNGHTYIVSNGQTALFVCDEGYSAMGSAISYCASGKWSFPPPECKKSS